MQFVSTVSRNALIEYEPSGKLLGTGTVGLAVEADCVDDGDDGDEGELD